MSMILTAAILIELCFDGRVAMRCVVCRECAPRAVENRNDIIYHKI